VLDYAVRASPRFIMSLHREGIICMRRGGEERWLLASVVVASLVAMITTVTTAGQWLIQWPVFVQWVEQIVR